VRRFCFYRWNNGDLNPTRGFEPPQKGGITPVRQRRILQGGEAQAKQSFWVRQKFKTDRLVGFFTFFSFSVRVL
jgi:hypothetical protein